MRSDIQYPEEDFEIIADDEGSPRKIRRISEEPEDEEEIFEKSPEKTSNQKSKLNRSKSFFIETFHRPFAISKSFSTTSLRKTSISDDSGFQSEVSSPDVFKRSPTISSKNSTITTKKSKKNKILQHSERLFNYFLK